MLTGCQPRETSDRLSLRAGFIRAASISSRDAI